MKNNFSRVLALTLLVSVSSITWAQPNIVPPKVVEPLPQPKDADFDRAENNADALALMGAFYNKLTRAKTYRGRSIVVTTTTNGGKVLAKKTVEMESSCIGDEEIQGAFKKDASNFVVTRVLNGKTTVEKFRSVDDGIKNYRFNETKNIWSERPQEEGETTPTFDLVDGSWMIALAMFGAGREFEIEHQVVGGQNQIRVQSQPEDEYIFDAKIGDLLSYNRTVSLQGIEDVKVEVRWLQHEFDVPLADSVFEWKAPDGAAKVAPEKMNFQDFLGGP